MSTVISFSKRDLLKGKIVNPDWYRCRVESIGEEAAKASEKGPSTNFPVEVTILFNGESGSTEFTDVPITYMFNSKGLGFAIGFLEAFGVTVEEGKRFDLKSAEGKELDIYIENDLYQNRVTNRVNHKYRKPSLDVVAVSA